MKLNEYAKQHGISYRTAWNWFKQGKIQGAKQLHSGTIIINEEEDVKREERVVVYARVSNALRRTELDYQVDRCLAFCAASGLVVAQTYKEVASGMNDKRKQMWAMLDSCPTTIVVENKDRLTRFGFNYLEKLLDKQGTKIVLLHPNQCDEADLIKDLVSVITSFCCRLYGLRRGKAAAKRAIEEIKEK